MIEYALPTTLMKRLKQTNCRSMRYSPAFVEVK